MNLTDTERETLARAFAGSSRSPDHLAFLAAPAVEAIITARLAPALALHARIPIRPWAENCADANHVHDYDDRGIADVCSTCPPTGEAICGVCFDGEGGDPEPWPCPTAAALGASAPTGATP